MSLEHPEFLEGTILVRLHYFTLAGAFIVDAAKVEDTVNDDTMELALIGSTHQFGIGGYGVERQEYVAADTASACIVEGDDVGVIIVTKKLAVDLENLFISTEDIVDRTEQLAVIGDYLGYPSFDLQTVYGRKLSGAVSEPLDFIHVYKNSQNFSRLHKKAQ